MPPRAGDAAAPGQADFRPRPEFVQPRPPVGDALRVSAQITRVVRKVLAPIAEKPRQAAHRNLPLDRVRLLAPAGGFGCRRLGMDAGAWKGTAEQRKQLRIAFDDAAANACNRLVEAGSEHDLV